MAEPSGHGAIQRKSSGNGPNRTDPDQPPPSPPLQRSRSLPDLISALPDAVIHSIFSFLPLEDVVRTSVLCKRWRSTWTSTADLVFDGEIVDRPGSTLDVSSLVDSVLNQCTSRMLKRFHVADFQHDCADSPKVDFWLRFAVQRHVEDLRLSPHGESPSSYLLPGFLCCLNWLVRLEVSSCRFSSDMTIRWPCLKYLSIRCVELSDGSPVLETLKLEACRGMTNIMIDSTSLKKLVLSYATFSRIKKIWVPHLLLLRVSGWWSRRCNLFSLDDISSLVEAELDFQIPFSDKRMWCKSLKGTLEKLHQVPTITIGVWCLEVLSLLEMEGVCPLMSKCQNLTLHGPVGQWDLPGIAYMLRSSHCLENLVIHLRQSTYKLGEECFNVDEEVFLYSRKGDFQCLAKHLKRVKIIGSKADSFGSKHLLALIKFLLGNALMLKELIIRVELPARHGQKHFDADVLAKLLGVSKNVLRYRRASKYAEVVFNYPFELVSS